METIQKKLVMLKKLLTELDSVMIAYSGGVDSAFLLRVALEVLGTERVQAVMIVSETGPPGETQEAIRLAQALGAPLKVLPLAELENKKFTDNAPDRCYHCKFTRFTRLMELAREHGLVAVVDGSNADDAQDYRPGQLAGRELGVRSPLQEVGLTKNEIRILSREMNLPTWNKPASSCLASRIPYGQPITREKLVQIGRAERYLQSLGLRQVRVRHHGQIARIEVQTNQFSLLLQPAAARRVVNFFKSLGFIYITLDMEGYQMGSLNREIGGRPAHEHEELA
ncbi:MAG: ATP-dependent sacrificial sulfur transferase LarE [Firmicutes bacterium]|nr:ATP-dependent sacrificial sulfur transferase LarE [Bacillota bacterium]